MAGTPGSAVLWLLCGTAWLMLRKGITEKCHTASQEHYSMMGPRGVASKGVQGCKACWMVLEVLSVLSSGAGWCHRLSPCTV